MINKEEREAMERLKKHLDIWLKKHDITESKEN